MSIRKARPNKLCRFHIGFCVLSAVFRHTQMCGGSALVRRRIQTPSDATVLSVVQPEGEVVLGASPPARRAHAVSAVGRLGGIRARGKAAPPSTVDRASAVSAARRTCATSAAGRSGGRRRRGKAAPPSTVDSASAVSAARRTDRYSPGGEVLELLEPPVGCGLGGGWPALRCQFA